MSVARFIADQRTLHRVPHTITCALLGVSVSWFYKWASRTPTPTELRRARVDAAVAAAFEAARGLHGSPRWSHLPMLAVSRRPSPSRCAANLVARRIPASGLTRQDKTHRIRRLAETQFTARAEQPLGRDMTEIPTRPASSTGHRHRPVLPPAARAATGCTPMRPWPATRSSMAVAARGDSTSSAVIFHADRGSTSPPIRSPRCAAVWVSGSRWARLGRASTTPRPKHSSPAWNGRCCPGTSSIAPVRPAPL